MLDVLSRALSELPKLLRSDDAWYSMDIDYHPPRVERLFHNWGKHRIMLHRIEPCAKEEALFHPHPWPSAMRVLKGTYWMRVGSAAGVEPPPEVFEVMVTVGPDTDFRYAMTHPDGWHVVIPVGGPVYSVMVIGPYWDRPIPKVTRDAAWAIEPLPDARKIELLDEFRELVPMHVPRLFDSIG
jgi:hypothetical protein